MKMTSSSRLNEARYNRNPVGNPVPPQVTITSEGNQETNAASAPLDQFGGLSAASSQPHIGAFTSFSSTQSTPCITLSDYDTSHPDEPPPPYSTIDPNNSEVPPQLPRRRPSNSRANSANSTHSAPTQSSLGNRPYFSPPPQRSERPRLPTRPSSRVSSGGTYYNECQLPDAHQSARPPSSHQRKPMIPHNIPPLPIVELQYSQDFPPSLPTRPKSKNSRRPRLLSRDH